MKEFLSKKGTPTTYRKQVEKVDERATVKWAEAQNILVTKMMAVGKRGWPDRCFWIYGGKPFLIEFKAEGEVPTKLQNHLHALLERLGYDVEVHDNKESAIAAIKIRLARAKQTEIAAQKKRLERIIGDHGSLD